MLDVLEGLEGLAGMLDEDQCDCWFNKTEVKNSGGWEKTDDSMAGGSSVHDRDPIRCLKSCREQFLATVLPGYNNETDTETFKSVCGKLTAKGPNLDLWPLYWCDSTLCGVWIDPAVKSGQDPNVDLIINQCQNIGCHSILDPGPPPPNYTCITNTDKVDDGTLGLCSNHHGLAQTTQASAVPQPPATTTTYTSSLETSTILATQSGRPPSTTHPTTTSTPSKAETTLLSSNAPAISPTPSQTDADLPAGAKVAIAVCSALSLLAALCLALFLLHRRRKHRRSSLPSSVKDRIRLYPAGSPTAPLINTTTRPPLTPPLRLRDRKFLPSILRQSRSPSPPLTPLTPAAVFPSSPICSPTTNRLIPRHERTPKIYYGPNSPPLSPPPIPPAYFADRGSLGSTVTFAPSTKSSGQSVSVSSLRNEMVPSRPVRPHETPLEIPDLVSPAGPPPNRALPPRPMQTPVIVVDGASPCPSPENGSGGKGSGRGRGMSLDLNFGRGR